MIIWKLKLKEQEPPFGDNYHCAKISGRLINKNNSYRMETIVSTDRYNRPITYMIAKCLHPYQNTAYKIPKYTSVFM